MHAQSSFAPDHGLTILLETSSKTYYKEEGAHKKGQNEERKCKALGEHKFFEFEQGTNQNKLGIRDIEKIVDTYRKRATIDKYSYLATYAEIDENEFNLNIPRYVDTLEPEPEIDIVAVQKEIEEIEGKLAETRTKMDGYLRELEF